jgi:hypothetical protein
MESETAVVPIAGAGDGVVVTTGAVAGAQASAVDARIGRIERDTNRIIVIGMVMGTLGPPAVRGVQIPRLRSG